MKNKKKNSPEYLKAPLGRRELLMRTAGVVSAGVITSYLGFAPENYPFSLKDQTGKRGQPLERKFQLPDFRVKQKPGFPSIGIGRNGETRIRLQKALDAIGGITGFVQKGDVVLIKPNVAFDRSPILGATTDPQILQALIQLVLIDGKAAEVRVADNPIESPEDCFAKSGIKEATLKAGGRVSLPDSNSFETLYTPGATLIENWSFLKRPFKDVTKVIGLAPIKDHNLCSASMGIKNWYGLLGGRRNQFHQNIHEIIADLSIMIKPTLTVLDGTRVLMENGPTGGDPSYVKEKGLILATTDPVAGDTWAYEHLLERSDRPPEYLRKAEQRGSGKMDYQGRVKEII